MTLPEFYQQISRRLRDQFGRGVRGVRLTGRMVTLCRGSLTRKTFSEIGHLNQDVASQLLVCQASGMSGVPTQSLDNR